MNSAVGINRAIKTDLLLVVGFELALVVGLHLLGGAQYAVPLSDVGNWLSTADPVTALVAIARLAGLAIGYWLLLTTIAYATAHLFGWTTITGVLRWFTLPVVRRMVQGVTAMSLTSASLLGPAVVVGNPAFAQEEAMVVTDDGSDSTVGDADDYLPDAAGWPEGPPPGPSDGTGDDFWRPQSQVASQVATTYTVKRSDHFWKIAEDHLRSSVDYEPTEDQVCQYWVRVVEANRSILQSGDPDLIYPGEEIQLPSVYDD